MLHIVVSVLGLAVPVQQKLTFINPLTPRVAVLPGCDVTTPSVIVDLEKNFTSLSAAVVVPGDQVEDAPSNNATDIVKELDVRFSQLYC